MCNVLIQTSVQTPHHKSVSVEYKSKSFLASSSYRKNHMKCFLPLATAATLFVKCQSTRVICLSSVCVCACYVCVYACVYLHVHTCMYTYVNRYMCVYVCVCTCLWVFMWVYMLIRVYCMLVCVCVYVVHLCVLVCVCATVCVCMRDFLRLH